MDSFSPCVTWFFCCIWPLRLLLPLVLLCFPHHSGHTLLVSLTALSLLLSLFLNCCHLLVFDLWLSDLSGPDSPDPQTQPLPASLPSETVMGTSSWTGTNSNMTSPTPYPHHGIKILHTLNFLLVAQARLPKTLPSIRSSPSVHHQVPWIAPPISLSFHAALP